jgi:hypothetical protein
MATYRLEALLDEVHWITALELRAEGWRRLAVRVPAARQHEVPGISGREESDVE